METPIKSGAFNNNPKNKNKLQSNSFELVFLRIPHVKYTTQNINLPGISMESTRLSNPRHYSVIDSGKVSFEPLNLEFGVDENLENYYEIFNWITSINPPDDIEKYNKLIESFKISTKKDEHNIFSDATLSILTNAGNYNISIIFKNMFPISLTGLDFTTTGSTPMKASVSFEYTSYEIGIDTV